MKTITIEVPDGCEVKIVKKEEKKEEKKESVIRTYQDLIDNEAKIGGVYIGLDSKIFSIHDTASKHNINIAASEKVAKSMLAMAMISQLMPYYGGEVTDEEWKDSTKHKYIIALYQGEIIKCGWNICNYYFLAFHTVEQRNNFLKYNEQLVKDYLMID